MFRKNTKIHWVRIPKPLGENQIVACGNARRNDRFSSFIGFVDCEECKSSYHILQLSRVQKHCTFCGSILLEADYNDPNDFYLSCRDHKLLAQRQTEFFFAFNPDYIKWSAKHQKT